MESVLSLLLAADLWENNITDVSAQTLNVGCFDNLMTVNVRDDVAFILLTLKASEMNGSVAKN